MGRKSEWSFVKFIPNRKAFSNLYIISAEILHRRKSEHLASLVTTKKEICIDLALNSLFNLAGLARCGFLIHSQSLLCRLGPGLNTDNNRIEYLKHFGPRHMKILPFAPASGICFIDEFEVPTSQSCGMFQPHFILLVWKHKRKERNMKYDFFSLEPLVIGKHKPTILIATFS